MLVQEILTGKGEYRSYNVAGDNQNDVEAASVPDMISFGAGRHELDMQAAQACFVEGLVFHGCQSVYTVSESLKTA